MRITAAVTETAGAPFALQDVDMEQPRPDEVLVRMVAAGICHSDLSARDQLVPVPLPIVLGHEGAGIVESAGPSVTQVKPGDPVLLTFMACGHCSNCAAGSPTLCFQSGELNLGPRSDGTSALSRDGVPLHAHFFGQSSFATYSMASERNCVKLDPDLDLTLAPAFACGALTGAGAVLNGLQPDAGTSIAVFGTGAVGMAAMLGAVVSGCTTIIAVDRIASRLDLASELGATHTVLADGDDLAARIRGILPLGVAFAVETTGVVEVTGAAINSLQRGGHLALLGLGSVATMIPISQYQLAMQPLHVHGFPSGSSVPTVVVPRLVELFKQGRFPIDRLVTTMPFNEINHGAEQAANGSVVKPVLLF
jgi:aryl-alcohol dehydrogenase